jgi:O-antigen ligase
VKLNLVQKISINLFPIVAVAISPFYNIDSISLPKSVVLASSGFIGIIYIVLNLPQLISQLNSTVKLISLGLLICIFVSFFSSQSPKVQLIFGREGRYNGSITFVSLVILFVISATVNLSNSNYILKNIVISMVIISAYSILQLLNLDPISWDTVNIKYFGTFGNPNFLSSFLAVSTIPVLASVYIKMKKENTILKVLLYLIINTISIYLIYKTYSLQGFIVLVLANFIWLLFWLYSKNRFRMMYSAIFIGFFSSYLSLIGTLNKGPLADVLYKSSITSRGDFFRSAIAATKDNWVAGVGPDSFGDYYLMYRDTKAANRSNAEIADSAHNYFLDLSANFGIFMLAIYLAMIVMTCVIFIKIYRKTNFNNNLLVLFTIWSGLIIQSLISPLNSVFLTLIFLFSGFVLGNKNYLENEGNAALSKIQLNSKYPIIVGLICAFIVVNPIVQRDHAILVSNNAKRLDLLLLAIDKYPKSSTGYNKVMVILNDQGDSERLIVLARKAADFNDRSSAAQLFVFQNSLSSDAEKSEALKKLIALDPNNLYFNQFLIK